MTTHRQHQDLPPLVAAYVQRQLVRQDWEQLLSDLRTLCADCPAARDPDVCSRCPLEGIALDAATLALKARVAKLQKVGKTRQKHNK